MKIVAFSIKPTEIEFMSKYNEVKSFNRPLTVETLNKIKEADGILVSGTDIVDENVVKAMKDKGIKALITRSIGFNQIDTDALKKYDIRFDNTHYSPEGVAEFVVMQILMSLRRIKYISKNVHNNDFRVNFTGRQLSGLKVGFIGYGNIGKQVHKLLSGFECEFMAYDPTNSDESIKDVSLDELLMKSDVISINAPLTPSTFHMIDNKALKKMKSSAIIINSARGEIIDTHALLNALENHKIAGCALDVIEDERDIYSGYDGTARDIFEKLKDMDNVIITPHIAFATNQAIEEMVDLSVSQMIDIIEK